MAFSDKVRNYSPDIKLFRDFLKWGKIKKIKRYSLSSKTVKDAENNPDKKRIIVEECKKKWNSEYTKAEKEYQQTIKEFNDVVIAYGQMQIKTDCLFCYFGYGFSVGEFFAFELYRKSYEERRQYISDRYRQIISYYLNDFVEMEKFFDKWKTYQYYPDLYKREAICVSNEKDKSAFTEFIEKHPSFIVKPERLSRGRGVQLLQKPSNNNEISKMFSEICKNGNVIIEEKIKQGEAIGKFHPESVNTIRCVAIVKNNHVLIPYCILRVGRGGSVVDNVSAGGIMAIVDPDNGVVCSDGMSEKNEIFITHPDTNIPFNGYQIPKWNELIELVNKAAFRNPKIRFVGWDIAYSEEKGWLIVEGNCTPQLEARQVACGCGMKHIFDDIIGREL